MALGMEVLVADPFATVSDAEHRACAARRPSCALRLCGLLSRSPTKAPKILIGQAALARMRPHAFFINLSRGNLVDEAALIGCVAREPHCRRGDGCRPRAGPDADTGTGEAAECHRDAAYRRADAAGDRKPVAPKPLVRWRRSSMSKVPAGAVNAASWTRRP